MDEYQLARERRAYLNAASEFINRYGFDIYCTPTFCNPVSRRGAAEAVRQFVAGFGEQAYAYVAYERGREFGRYHAHCLIGGLSRIHRGQGWRLWKFRDGRNGDIRWDAYDPTRGAAAYLFKDAFREPDSGEFIGHPVRRVPRKRGRRGRGARGAEGRETREAEV